MPVKKPNGGGACTFCDFSSLLFSKISESICGGLLLHTAMRNGRQNYVQCFLLDIFVESVKTATIKLLCCACCCIFCSAFWLANEGT